MKYKVEKDCIKVYSKDEFNPQHILECGQVFCYKKEERKYIVFPQNEYAEIEDKEDFYLISTKNPLFFVKWFDLDENYVEIKEKLLNFQIMQKPIEFGYGIRILKQSVFEMLISFILSANNNIKRFTQTLNLLRKYLGDKLAKDIYSFPSYKKLKECDEEFFKSVGAGYRSKYLVNVLKQTTPEELENMNSLSTKELRNKLIELSGVGPKVADCILLFGYNRRDVFPVDTWIEQMYNSYFSKEKNRNKIREHLTFLFDKFSGYAQQYLFYYQRSGKVFE